MQIVLYIIFKNIFKRINISFLYTFKKNIMLYYIMVVTEEDYQKYAYKIREKRREQRSELELHNGYYGRRPYYPFKLDEWKKIGNEMPKKHATEIKQMKEKLKKMEIEIEEHHKNLMMAATTGPTCAICLDEKYAEEGPNMAVSFNNTKCKNHIFHHQCVSDGRVKKCPICQSDKKKLTNVDKDKLSKMIKRANTHSPKTKKRATRCPKGTRRDAKTQKCVSNNDTKSVSKRCPNGTRKNKVTGKCEKK